MIDDDGVLKYVVSERDIVTGTTNVADGRWHHVAVTNRGRNYVIYVDGESEASSILRGPPWWVDDDPSHVVVIGLVKATARRDRPGAFGGMMDDVRFYDRTLSPEEIQVVVRETDHR
jgi:hypothetical protein